MSEAPDPLSGSSATARATSTVSQSGKYGFYLSASLVLLGGVSLVLVDLHKRRIRHRKKRQLEHSRSIQSTTTFASSTCCPSHSSRGGSFIIGNTRSNASSVVGGPTGGAASASGGVATPIIVLAGGGNSCADLRDFNSEEGRVASVVMPAAPTVPRSSSGSGLVAAAAATAIRNAKRVSLSTAGAAEQEEEASGAAAILPQVSLLKPEHLSLISSAAMANGNSTGEMDGRHLLMEMSPLDEEEEEEEEEEQVRRRLTPRG